jgi:hypothetical protein
VAHAASDRNRSGDPSGDQEHGGGAGADAMQGEQPKGAGGRQEDDELIEALIGLIVMPQPVVAGRRKGCDYS